MSGDGMHSEAGDGAALLGAGGAAGGSAALGPAGDRSSPKHGKEAAEEVKAAIKTWQLVHSGAWVAPRVDRVLVFRLMSCPRYRGWRKPARCGT